VISNTGHRSVSAKLMWPNTSIATIRYSTSQQRTKVITR
jgi:hypothetical protein